MKRVLYAAGIVLAAATLCLTTATCANAATGTLDYGGQLYQDPSGCYNSPVIGAVTIYNDTDQVVTVFGNDSCTGPVNGTLQPGGSGNFEFGASVSVP